MLNICVYETENIWESHYDYQNQEQEYFYIGESLRKQCDKVCSAVEESKPVKWFQPHNKAVDSCENMYSI